MGGQEEYSREKGRWKRVIFDGKNLIERTRHPKDASSLGIGMDLAWEEVEETPKVVTVFFLYFIPWVLGLCNHFNIVSSVQLDKEETSWFLPPSTTQLGQASERTASWESLARCTLGLHHTCKVQCWGYRQGGNWVWRVHEWSTNCIFQRSFCHGV